MATYAVVNDTGSRLAAPPRGASRLTSRPALPRLFYSGIVLGVFWSATMNTRILARLFVLGFRDVEWIAVGRS